MGEVADYYVRMFVSGRYGENVLKKREFPRTTKHAIQDKTFYVVEVIGGNTNRVVGTKLIVCNNDENSYWVYARNGVTGIQKDVCKIISPPLSLEDAKVFRKTL